MEEITSLRCAACERSWQAAGVCCECGAALPELGQEKITRLQNPPVALDRDEWEREIVFQRLGLEILEAKVCDILVLLCIPFLLFSALKDNLALSMATFVFDLVIIRWRLSCKRAEAKLLKAIRQ